MMVMKVALIIFLWSVAIFVLGLVVAYLWKRDDIPPTHW